MGEPVDQPRRAIPPWLLGLAGVLALGWLVFALRAVLTPIFFAFLIAYMLDPIVDRLERLRLPRAAAITVLLAVVLSGLGVLLLLVVPGVLRDIADVFQELPAAAQRLRRQWEPVLASYGVPVPHSLSEALEQLSSDTQDLARQAVAPAAAAIRGIVGGTANAVAAAVGLLMVPVFSFYLLYDFDRMIAAIGDLVPLRYRRTTYQLAREVDEVVGQWVRGQVVVMICLGVLYAVGYSALGVRLAVPIALVAGLLSFIPYLGGGLALGLALAMCAFDFRGWGQVGGVVGVYAAVQVLEGFVITPKVVGEKVGLSAVWVLFALMVAGEIFGFLGVLLAVPGAAVCKIFIVRAIEVYRRSDLYRRPPDDDAMEGEGDSEGDAADCASAGARDRDASDEIAEEPGGVVTDAANVPNDATDATSNCTDADGTGTDTDTDTDTMEATGGSDAADTHADATDTHADATDATTTPDATTPDASGAAADGEGEEPPPRRTSGADDPEP